MNDNTVNINVSEYEDKFKQTLDAAVDTALWSTMPTPHDMGDQFIESADQYIIDDAEMTKLRGTIAYFLSAWFVENIELIESTVDAWETYGWDQVGHDWWLDTQGHGAGFWDRGLGSAGDKLSESAQGHNDIVHMYLDDDSEHLLIDTYNVMTFNDKLSDLV